MSQIQLCRLCLLCAVQENRTWARLLLIDAMKMHNELKVFNASVFEEK